MAASNWCLAQKCASWLMKRWGIGSHAVVANYGSACVVGAEAITMMIAEPMQ
jgi:hypothetical protein